MLTDTEVRDLIAYLMSPVQVPLPHGKTNARPRCREPPGSDGGSSPGFDRTDNRQP